jgi:hypothetical protein
MTDQAAYVLGLCASRRAMSQRLAPRRNSERNKQIRAHGKSAASILATPESDQTCRASLPLHSLAGAGMAVTRRRPVMLTFRLHSRGSLDRWHWGLYHIWLPYDSVPYDSEDHRVSRA